MQSEWDETENRDDVLRRELRSDIQGRAALDDDSLSEKDVASQKKRHDVVLPDVLFHASVDVTDAHSIVCKIPFV